MFSQLISFL